MIRSNNFDGLRLIAALTVLCSHMAAVGGEQEWKPAHDFTWGILAVTVFFAISGYLVMKSWRSDPDIGRFLERRFLRLAPALGVSIPLTILAMYAFGEAGFPDNPLHRLNGSLWTIEIEVYCYVALVGLSLITRAPAVLALLVPILAFTLGYRDYLALFAPFFAGGMLLAEYKMLKRWSLLAVPLGVLALPYSPYSLVLIVVPLTIFIGTQSWPALRSAGRYGDFSYGIYIYAWPVQQLIVAMLGAKTNYFVLLATTIPIVVALGWASWRFIEHPWLDRKPAKPSRRAEGSVYATTARAVAAPAGDSGV